MNDTPQKFSPLTLPLLACTLFMSAQSVHAAVYYVAPDGHDSDNGSLAMPWRSAQKAANAAVAGDTVYFQAGVYHGSLVPEHSGTPDAYITFSAAPGAEKQAILDQGQVAIIGKSYIRVHGLKVQNAPDIGIFIRGVGSHIDITNNYVYKTGSSGIAAWGTFPWRGSDPAQHEYQALSHITVANNTIEQACLTGWNETITFANGIDQFEINGNLLINGGHPRVGGEGIDIKEGVSNGSIHHNEITNIARIAIYVDGGRGGNYAAPMIRNIDIHSNYVHDSGSEGISIVTEGVGGVDGVRVYNNVVANMTANGILVYDHPSGSGPVSNIEIVNNTSYGNARTGLLLNHRRASHILMRNNIAYANGRDLWVQAIGPGLIEDHNLTDQDPLFVDVESGDFHLSTGSPAIDAGTDAQAPIVDFDGKARPVGIATDLGALEFRSTREPEGPNQRPVAIAQSLSTVQATPLAIVLTAHDPDADPLSYQFETPSNGVLSGVAPNLFYTPSADFVGDDAFSFTVSDDEWVSEPAVVTISVTEPVNHQPALVDDSGSTAMTTALTLAVLANDRIDDGVSALVINQVPANGTVSVNSDNSLTYTPDTGFIGTDRFTYRVTDTDGDHAEAEVVVTVEDQSGLFAHWLINEGAGNTLTDRSHHHHDGSLHGPSWQNTDPLLPGLLTFDGVDDYVDLGPLDVSGDAMTLMAWFRSDDLGNCHSFDCRIISKAKGVSGHDHYWMLSTIRVGGQTRLRFRLKTNGTTSTLIAGSGDIQADEWVHVAAVYNGSQMILYQNGLEVGRLNKTGPVGTDAQIPVWLGSNPPLASSRPWEGQIRDVWIYEQALTPLAIGDIMVGDPVDPVDPVDHLPEAVDDKARTTAGQAVTLNVLSNDQIEDGISDLILTESPTAGSATVNADNTITYTPDDGFSGDDLFRYQLSDNDGDTAHATVTVTVETTDDLLGYWPLNQGNGNTALDQSGRNIDGQLVGPEWIGNELNFDGLNDYVNLGPVNVSGNSVTFSAWVHSDNLANCQWHDCRILSKATGVSEQAHNWMLSGVRFGNETRLRFRLKTNGVTHTLIADQGSLQAGEWMHVAAVYDGSQMLLYLNGVEVGRRAKSGTIDTHASTPAWIGGNPDRATSRPWDGRIRAVRIDQRAFTAEAIHNLAVSD